jgi:hypothetical protein
MKLLFTTEYDVMSLMDDIVRKNQEDGGGHAICSSSKDK